MWDLLCTVMEAIHVKRTELRAREEKPDSKEQDWSTDPKRVLMKALEPFPEAYQAVIRALRAAYNYIPKGDLDCEPRAA